MSRPTQMATALALAVFHLPTATELSRRTTTAAGDEPRLPPDPDPEAERIKAELRERRRQNFLKQRKP